MTYFKEINGTLVHIEQNADGKWEAMTMAPFGELGEFDTLSQAFNAAEDETLIILREREAKRGNPTARDAEEF